MIRSGLLKCTRSHAKKVSRQSTIALQERISESMCEQIGVVEVPKISNQESVEAVKIVPQERIPEMMCEQIGIIEVPNLSRQESVEAIKIANF